MRKKLLIIIMILLLGVLAAGLILTPYTFYFQSKLINKIRNYTIETDIEVDSVKSHYQMKTDTVYQYLLYDMGEEDDNLEVYIEKAGDKKYAYIKVLKKWYKREVSDKDIADFNRVYYDDYFELLDFDHYELNISEKKYVLKSDCNLKFMYSDIVSASYKNYLYKIVFNITVRINDDEIRDLTITFKDFFKTKIELPTEYEEIDLDK